MTAGYDDAIVLRDVSLGVGPGSVVALLGPNGAGKTTLLNVVTGVLQPSSGRVVLGGEDVTKRAIAQRAKRGLCHIPEGHGVFPSLTVKENILLAGPRGKESESFDKAVEAFPVLGERRSQIAGSLSGGQQQMLAVVRAYIQSPKLVLIDEVSMGLAPVIVDQIFEFIEQIAAQGTSLLLVEQYVSRVLAIASHVYVLNRGEIAFSGTPQEASSSQVFDTYLSAASH
ncbi:ABC transporter ATP-binding protein [Nocardia flavorosea]|uniref:ABC transporter ATP-binding protein n=1 Tax=Nocardia flavorosea TaxID=53429 RepID=UPI001FDEBA39|nr:ABC transporter ATP-binding protein [Nocardia flavorosea]